MAACRQAETEGTLTLFPAGANFGVFEGFHLLVSFRHGAFRAIHFPGCLTTRALSGLQRLGSRLQLRQALLRIVVIAQMRRVYREDAINAM
jgi:hypothetical protein